MSGDVSKRAAGPFRREGPAVGVADGDPAVRGGLCALLESCGYSPRPYGDAQVLTGGAEPLPSCLILSLELPGLSPPDVLGRVRLLAPDTRVIVVASCPDARITLDLLRSGVADVLEMPFPPEKLIERVAEIVARTAPAAP
jgi:FixJ family two-component response regulator